jgi:hypothetical protein
MAGVVGHGDDQMVLRRRFKNILGCPIAPRPPPQVASVARQVVKGELGWCSGARQLLGGQSTSTTAPEAPRRGFAQPGRGYNEAGAGGVPNGHSGPPKVHGNVNGSACAVIRSGGRQSFEEPRHAVSTIGVAYTSGTSCRIKLQGSWTVDVKPYGMVEREKASLDEGVQSTLHPRERVGDMVWIAAGQQRSSNNSAIFRIVSGDSLNNEALSRRNRFWQDAPT